MTEELDLFTQEIWVTIKDFEIYQISNQGRFRKILKNGKFSYIDGGTTDNNYKILCLTHNGKRRNVKFHRLVLEAFEIPEDIFNPQVNHKNGNKHDNRLDNLERSNHQHNNAHASKLKLKTNFINYSNRFRPSKEAKKDEKQYITEFLKHHEKIVNLMEQGVSQNKIRATPGIVISRSQLLYISRYWKKSKLM